MRDLSRLLNDELESFYWIGFMMADGWVTSGVYNGSRHERFGVQLSEVDGLHLEKLASYIGSSVSYGCRDTNFKVDSRYCRLGVNDSTNVPKIRERFGFLYNRKTDVAPNWSDYMFSDEQLLSLFIGYIDGDGSINERKGGGKLHLSIQTKATWKDNIEFMLYTIQRVTGIHIASRPVINCRGHLHLSICKNLLIWKLKEFALANALPILERKWDKVSKVHSVRSRNTSKIITFRSPSGSLHTYSSIRKFASSVGLNYNGVLRLTSKRIPNYNGWSVYEEV